MNTRSREDDSSVVWSSWRISCGYAMEAETQRTNAMLIKLLESKGKDS